SAHHRRPGPVRSRLDRRAAHTERGPYDGAREIPLRTRAQVGHPLVARIGSCRGAGGRAAEGAMMLTVDEARRALERLFEQNRPLIPVTLYIAPQAWKDDLHYVFK